MEGTGVKTCSKIKQFCGQSQFGKLWVKQNEIHRLYSQPSLRLSNAKRRVGLPKGPRVQPFSSWSDQSPQLPGQQFVLHGHAIPRTLLRTGVLGLGVSPWMTPAPLRGWSVNFDGKKTKTSFIFSLTAFPSDHECRQ